MSRCTKKQKSGGLTERMRVYICGNGKMEIDLRVTIFD
jgi:hypothetical protein